MTKRLKKFRYDTFALFWVNLEQSRVQKLAEVEPAGFWDQPEAPAKRRLDE